MYIDKRHPNAWTEIWDFQLVGSSFQATGGTSRQASLRRAAKKQDDLCSCDTVSVDLERYEYEGAPAYRVYFDEREVGNVPADVAAELAKMEDAGYAVFGDSCEVYGGPEYDMPDKKYGARLYVKLRREPTDAEQQQELIKLARKAPRQSAPAASSEPSPAFVVSESGFPRASDGASSSSCFANSAAHRPASSSETRGPDIPDKKPRKKARWPGILAAILLIYVVVMVGPHIISDLIGANDFKNSDPAIQAAAQATTDRLASEPPAEPSPAQTESSPAAEEPFSPPSPISYSGTGDDYFDISPFDSLYYFQITGNADADHFAVTGYDANGGYTELFVNTTDAYSGCVLDPEQNTRTLEINATGSWTVTIVSIYTAPVVTTGELYSGIGDAVLLIPSGSRSAVINGNSWSRHFAVHTYGSSTDLLVNTVDPYSGTVRVDSDAVIMTIDAEGGWSVLMQ